MSREGSQRYENSPKRANYSFKRTPFRRRLTLALGGSFGEEIPIIRQRKI